MPDNSITVTGGVVRDPELQFLNAGTAVVKFTVAVSRKWQNRQTQEWEEETSYFDVSQFGDAAENVANSLVKGTRVVVTGRLDQRSWETDNGEKRSAVEIKADEIAPSLRWATATIIRTPKASSPSGYEPTHYAFDEEPF